MKKQKKKWQKPQLTEITKQEAERAIRGEKIEQAKKDLLDRNLSSTFSYRQAYFAGYDRGLLDACESC